MNIVIETPKLIIRELVIEDAKYIYELDSSKEVMKYIAHTYEREFSLEFAKERVEYQINRYKLEPGFGVWPVILKETNEFTGWICLHQLDESNHKEIGYRYLEKFWGKGIATEAAKAVMDYGFNVMKLNEIVAIAMEGNKVSRKILEGLGMINQGKEVFYKKNIVFYRKIK